MDDNTTTPADDTVVDPAAPAMPVEGEAAPEAAPAAPEGEATPAA